MPFQRVPSEALQSLDDLSVSISSQEVKAVPTEYLRKFAKKHNLDYHDALQTAEDAGAVIISERSYGPGDRVYFEDLEQVGRVTIVCGKDKRAEVVFSDTLMGMFPMRQLHRVTTAQEEVSTDVATEFEQRIKANPEESFEDYSTRKNMPPELKEQTKKKLQEKQIYVTQGGVGTLDTADAFIKRAHSELKQRIAGKESKADVVLAIRPEETFWYENDDGEVVFRGVPEDTSLIEAGYYQNMISPLVVHSITQKDVKGEVARGEATFHTMDDVILHLATKQGWTLTDAIVAVANSCSRCMNIMDEQVTGEPYLERDASTTWCDHCAEIDSEYDRQYKLKESEREKADRFHEELKSDLRQAKLSQKKNENTGKEEWALISKKDASKVLKWFGVRKPSDDKVAEEEKRIQHFKHQSGLKKKAEEYYPDTATLEEVAEDWWREQGNEVPERGTPEHDAMYKQWHEHAFKSFRNKASLKEAEFDPHTLAQRDSRFANLLDAWQRVQGNLDEFLTKTKNYVARVFQDMKDKELFQRFIHALSGIPVTAGLNKKATYYALLDLDTKSYLHTGYNTQSLDELKEQLLSYYMGDPSSVEVAGVETEEEAIKIYEGMSAQELAEISHLAIDESEEPFPGEEEIEASLKIAQPAATAPTGEQQGSGVANFYNPITEEYEIGEVRYYEDPATGYKRAEAYSRQLNQWVNPPEVEGEKYWSEGVVGSQKRSEVYHEIPQTSGVGSPSSGADGELVDDTQENWYNQQQGPRKSKPKMNPVRKTLDYPVAKLSRRTADGV